MNVEVTRLPESRVALKIELLPAEVEQALDRTYKQLAQRLAIPGFRRGKAPRAVLERVVGQEFFLHEATDEAVRWGYRKAVDQEHLIPIDEAEIKPIDDGHDHGHSHVHPGESFQFEATVSVKPDVQLPDYHGLTVERETIEVSDEDINELLRRLQDAHATLEPVNRPSQYGDTVTINITGRAGGEDLIHDENMEYELRDEEESGPAPTLPGLSAQLVNSSRGDIKEFPLTLPEDYSDEDLQGKTLVIRALVKEIKARVLPDLDDDFAQTVSQYEDMDEVRAALRENLETERRYEADERLVQRVIDEITNRTFVEIPPVLIDEELDRMIGDIRNMIEQQRLSWDTYLQISNRSEEQVRDEMRETAVKNVKNSLVLGAVADRESIEATNREVTQSLEDLIRTMPTTDAERKQLRSSNAVRTNIRNRIRRQRAIERLVEIMSGGEQVSPEVTEAVADQTTAAAQDTEETVAVEVGS